MSIPPRNLLADQASPYLQQHAANPVHWRPWSASALQEARELDRPVLLSIGYAACHWCHVMAHESFEDSEIAAVMNRLFVNIKVDREERPDIDQIYMAALTAMNDQGGWPLTMFLTPDAKPFWGGTYFPPRARFGRHGFMEVLEAVSSAWRNKRTDILRSADTLSGHIRARLGPSHEKGALRAETLPHIAESIHAMIDGEAGGLKGAPKFPNAPFMHALWLSYLNTGDVAHRSAVIVSLEHMLAGGVYDHIGGGLARYSTDAQWLVPHFEKMLYDNAQLLRLANWALADGGPELFRIRIEETVDFLLREMKADGGAFASSLNADSEGEEGLFYVWDGQEIEDVLEKDSSLFFTHYSLAKPQSWEGKPILFQTHEQALKSAICSDSLKAPKQRLLEAREKRTRPTRDDKVLTDWNGLAIAALAECGRSFERPEWVEAARMAFRHIIDTAREGRLPHSTLGDKAQFPALSSDYAAMTNAAISLFEATGETIFIAHGRRFIEQLDRWHGDETGTGYYLTASDNNDVPMRIRGDVDEAIPSATSQIIEALTRLASVTGDTDIQEKAWSVAEHAAGRASRQSYGQIGIFSACELARQPHKLALIEESENPKYVPVANRCPDPRRIDLVSMIGDTVSVSLPGGLTPSTDKPGAYLCTGQTCLPVITDPAMLQKALKARS